MHIVFHMFKLLYINISFVFVKVIVYYFAHYLMSGSQFLHILR